MAIEEKKEDVIVDPKVETKIEDTKVKDDSEKTYEELKAEAEEAELKAKESKKDEVTDDEKRQNMIIRRNKAIEKAGKPETIVETTKENVDTRDLITLGKHDIAEGSEKAMILEKYKKGGLIKNFAEGLENLGIKAEFDAVDAKNKAKTVIDENDTDDVKVKTTKEIINSYRRDGNVPADKKAIKAIAEDNLKQMGL